MKKTRISVSIILVFAMVLTSALSAFAFNYPVKPKTELIVDVPMDWIYNWNQSSSTSNGYNNGKAWGVDWKTDGIGLVDEVNISAGIKVTTVVGQTGTKNISRKAFLEKKPETNGDIRFTYNITTGTFSPEAYQVWANVNGNSNGAQLFCYKANNGKLEFAGTQGGSWYGAEVVEGSYACVLQEGRNYDVIVDLVYNELTSVYDLYYTVTDTELDISLTGAVESYSRVPAAADFDTVGFQLYSVSAATTATEVLTINSIKIENARRVSGLEFGNRLLLSVGSGTGAVVMEEALSDIATGSLLDFDMDPDGDDLYYNGQRWAKAGPWSHEAIMAADGWLEVWAPLQNTRPATAGRMRKITKVFTPIENGEAREITFSVNATERFNEATYGYVNLLNNETGDYLNLFRIDREPGSPYKFTVATLGSFDASGNAKSGYGAEKYIYGPSDQFVNGGAGHTVVSDIKITFTPNADGETYTVVATGTDSTGATAGTFAFVNSTVPASDLEGYNTFEISSKQGNPYGTKRLFRIKNLKIAQAAEKTELEAGKNTLYLPCTNGTGDAKDYTLIASVCDKETDAAKKIYTYNQYLENSTREQNLEVEVEISNPATEYVKVYVFDNFDNLTPLAKPFSTK